MAQIGPDEDREEKGFGRKTSSTGRGPGDRKPPERCGGVPGDVSGCRREALAALLFQEIHVEVTIVLKPGFMDLDTESPHQTQAGLGIGEDPYHPGAELD